MNIELSVDSRLCRTGESPTSVREHICHVVGAAAQTESRRNDPDRLMLLAGVEPAFTA